MTYTVRVFADLLNQYPNWDTMKAFLQSDVGGSLTIKERDDSPYAMIFAKKGVLHSDEGDHMQWCRSVVWNKVVHRPVCVMTQKAEVDDPLHWPKLPASFKISTYEEGVTLMAFRECGTAAAAAAADEQAGEFKLASRSQFGARGKFFKGASKSFADMLDDALEAAGTTREMLGRQLGGCVERRAGDVSYFQSILVQHPEHRIVGVVESPKYIVLQDGVVRADGTLEIAEMVPEDISYAPLAGEQSLTAWFERISAGRHWSWQGVMIHDGCGERWRVRSPVYNMIRSLRGNTGRTDERFFGLRAAGLVKTYLIYYPEDSDAFWEYEKWLRKATGELFKYYIDVYKTRVSALNTIPGEWLVHVNALHGIYTKTLRTAGKHMRMSTVIEYMNTLPVPRILYLMNLHHRVAQGRVLTRTNVETACADSN